MFFFQIMDTPQLVNSVLEKLFDEFWSIHNPKEEHLNLQCRVMHEVHVCFGGHVT